MFAMSGGCMRKLGFVVVLLGLLIFSLSCDNPTESRSNPYEQQPIDWPSLADSPWPIWRGNPMGNGLSFIKGPSEGKILWKYTPSSITGGSLGLVIDSLNNIYAITKVGTLICLNSKGEIRWILPLGGSSYYTSDGETTPLVLRGNKIAVCVNKSFFIINSHGQIEKKIILPDRIWGSGFQVDKKGIFYALFDDSKIRAFDSDGNIYWELDRDYGGFCSGHVPIFFPDGQAILASTLKSIQKININGTVEWEYSTSYATPVTISSRGFIYFANTWGDTTITCLNSAGSVVWKIHYYEKDLAPLSHHSISYDGTIIMPLKLLTALSPEGKELWEIMPEKYHDFMTSDLVGDINGNIFGVTFSGDLYSIGPHGTKNWIIENQVDCRGSLALNNGVLYFSDFSYGDIYAIK